MSPASAPPQPGATADKTLRLGQYFKSLPDQDRGVKVKPLGWQAF